MSKFLQVPSDEPIRTVINAAFDTDLPLKGGWGYSEELATVIMSNPDNTPLSQLQHMIASMRAYLEMNITLEKEDRYGSINLNEKSRETVKKGDHIFHKVLYEISAMKENSYEMFINEYKEGYGKAEFDMEDHFKRRKEATLIREEPYWFEVSQVV